MTEKPNSGRGQRELRVRVKTAKGRKLSSTLWLERQLNDPYVIRAKKEGYRGRAAYKILELDDKYGGDLTAMCQDFFSKEIVMSAPIRGLQKEGSCKANAGFCASYSGK